MTGENSLQDPSRILEIRDRILDSFGFLGVTSFLPSPAKIVPCLERLRLPFLVIPDPFHFHIWGSYPGTPW